jgi:TPR repeat protein
MMFGVSYNGGLGVPQDYTQAALWYRKAAEQGYSDAQWMLGALYYKGQGVPQDYAEAYFWYDLAAAGKLDAPEPKYAAKQRDEAASRLTPADLSREQERARKWFEEHQAKLQ